MRIENMELSFHDIKSLDSIKNQSKDEALKIASQQFEALFLQTVLKQMRQTNDVFKSDLEENSQATKSFEDLYDGQISVEVSRQSNLGIADMIYKQLSEQNKK